jgi:integrase
MAVQKQANGRWRAFVKHGRQVVASKTFDTQQEAKRWHAAQKSRVDDGVNLKGGRVAVERRLAVWLAEREGTVSESTMTTDSDLVRVLPRWFSALSINAVTSGHIETLLGEWARTRAHGSVVRYRAALSSFFSSCERARLIAANPVRGVRAPRPTDPPREWLPFDADELDAAIATIAKRDERLADVVRLLGWTGLRWGEARALRVSDLVEVPSPALMVRRSQTEGKSVKVPKSGKVRRVPVPLWLVPVVHRMAENKAPDDLLVTTARGSQLHRTAFCRATNWTEVSQGRRLHDLRHTAACLWLANGVDPVTVKTWMGHSSLSVTDRYVHYLGTAADRAGLDQLAALGVRRGYVSGGDSHGTKSAHGL